MRSGSYCYLNKGSKAWSAVHWCLLYEKSTIILLYPVFILIFVCNIYFNYILFAHLLNLVKEINAPKENFAITIQRHAITYFSHRNCLSWSYCAFISFISHSMVQRDMMDNVSAVCTEQTLPFFFLSVHNESAEERFVRTLNSVSGHVFL